MTSTARLPGLDAILADRSWKGDHLIRSVPADPYQGYGHNFRKPGHAARQTTAKAAPAAPAARTVCVYPGCGTPLSRINRWGLCRAHTHAAGFCGCNQCLKSNRMGERR